MKKTTFILKKGLSGGALPSGLTHGEPAVNTTDARLFVGSITGNSIAVNTKYFSDSSIPSSTLNIQGDKWFKDGSEYTWITGTNGASGSWVETGNTVLSMSTQQNFLSVKDFGAAGDGRVDDTLSIQKALTTLLTASSSITADKFLLFPAGTYIISPSNRNSPGNVTHSCLFSFLPRSSGSLKLVGNNATLVCTGDSSAGGYTHASHMLWLQTGGNNVTIDGINFEGNNKTVYGLKIQETVYPYQSSINITNCRFRNMYIPGSNPFYVSNNFAESAGIFAYGSYNNVIIDKCFFQNITRAEMTVPTALTANSTAIVISGETINGTYQGTKTATISSCYIENVTSGETSAYGATSNIDCDGIKFFGGNVFGTDYVNCRASIYGNHFVNCRGRDIKVQADEVTIQANTSSLNILPITNGGVRINCQTSSGIVSNNVFHFDPVTGSASWKSPFIENGGLTAGGSVISFFDGVADQRNRTITVTDNIVFNNVPPSIGTLYEFFGNTEGDTSARPSGFITVQGNKIVGSGACLRFANLAGRSTASGQIPIYYTISDNMISTITGGNVGQTAAFCSIQNSSFNNTIMHVHGNVQSGVNPVPHAIDPSNQNVIVPANINAHSNWGIGLSANMRAARDTSFIPRLGMLGDYNSSEGGIIAVQSKLLNNTDSYTFPTKGYLGSGRFCMLTVGLDNNTNLMFVHGNADISVVYAGASAAYHASTNPGLANKVNVWLTPGYGTATVNVQNLLGDSRVFTLFSFG